MMNNNRNAVSIVVRRFEVTFTPHQRMKPWGSIRQSVNDSAQHGQGAAESYSILEVFGIPFVTTSDGEEADV